jgi:penicillin amidase
MPFLVRFLGPVARLWLGILCRRTMPRVSGHLRLRGLKSAVEVIRDPLGVPHIYARDAHDLLFAQGFVHAQDRLWQMEFQRRLAGGRLAELLGPKALDADRWTRTVGIHRAAVRDEKALSKEAREEIDAYVDGVNAFIETEKLPVELQTLRHTPAPWTAVDVLAWQKMVSWNLSMNWEGELLRALLARKVGAERAAELEPEWPEFWPVISEAITKPGGIGTEAIERDERFRRYMGPSASDGIGSNSWAISGSRTATGLPILANDMHMPLHAPSVWYENHLRCPEFHLAGVTFPGTPTIVAGHNGSVAWGFTNSCVDVQDLYQERLRTVSGGRVQYEFEGVWRDAVVVQERIDVKGRPSIVEEVVLTRHGPVINRGMSGLPRETPLALRWVSAEADSTTYAGYLMMRSRNCQEFREALRFWTSPCQNVVYADVEGNIAYTLAGRIPVRKKGTGRVPEPGWTGAREWESFIPFEELPHLLNPPEGFIATANNKIAGDGYRYYLGHEFCMGDRAERIVELIAKRPVVDLEYVKRMQSDLVSPTARRVGRHLAGLGEKDAVPPRVRTIMEGFEGELAADSAAAAVYEVFMRVFLRRALNDELGDLASWYMGKGPEVPLAGHSVFGFRAWEWVLKMLLDSGPRGHGDPARGRRAGERDGERENVRKLVSEALAETVVSLEKRLGKGSGSWAWGRLHTLTFRHLFGNMKPLKKFFDRGPYPAGGDGNTIWAGFSSMHEIDPVAHLGPPFRFIVDLADPENSMGVLVPGQSGVPLDPHYDDQIEDWFNGRYHRLLFKREDVEKCGGVRLELAPG